MDEKHYTVQGAVCKCNFGTLTDRLRVSSQNKVFYNDKTGAEKPAATTEDIGMTFEKNTFGKCKLQPTSGGFKPCIPALIQWLKYRELGGIENREKKLMYRLLEDSKGICSISGQDSICIIDHGQTAELSPQNLKNSDEAVLAELLPGVDFYNDPVEGEFLPDQDN